MTDGEVWFKCSVKGKIKSVYETKIIETPSRKHKGQPFKVVSTETLKNEFAVSFHSGDLKTTVKVDGTSCLIDYFNGRPWLWARHDVKPNKVGAKKFKTFQNNRQENELSSDGKEEKEFILNIETDFKEFPDDWKSASGLSIEDVKPDTNGHLVGWVPVDPSLRKHLWHLSAVDLNSGHGLVLLHQRGDDKSHFILSTRKLDSFKGKTFELIGTNVNGNPYCLGSKKSPVHMLVQHGVIPLPSGLILNEFSHEEFKKWFETNENGRVEGIVWHSPDGKMFKLHRHHLELPWPVKKTYLSQLPVIIDMSGYSTPESSRKNDLFEKMKTYDQTHLQHLEEIFKLEEGHEP